MDKLLATRLIGQAIQMERQAEQIRKTAPISYQEDMERAKDLRSAAAILRELDAAAAPKTELERAAELMELQPEADGISWAIVRRHGAYAVTSFATAAPVVVGEDAKRLDFIERADYIAMPKGVHIGCCRASIDAAMAAALAGG